MAIETWEWTATELITANDCIRKLYLLKTGVKVPLRPWIVKGWVFHNEVRKEKFYREDSSPIYKDAKAFAGHLGSRWMFHTQEGMFYREGSKPQKILWETENFQEQRGWIRAELRGIGEKFYEERLREKPPIFSEVKFNFYLDEKINGREIRRRFTGKIDEIREGDKNSIVIVRDYKLSRYVPDEKSLEYNLQLTLYTLAQGNLCFKNEDYANICSVSYDEARQWAGNPVFLSNRIGLEYYNIWQESIEDEYGKKKVVHIKITPSRRSDVSLEGFLETSRSLEERIKNEEWKRIWPNKLGCYRCEYRDVCREKKPYTQTELFEEKEEKVRSVSEIAPPRMLRKKERLFKQKRLRWPKNKES